MINNKNEQKGVLHNRYLALTKLFKSSDLWSMLGASCLSCIRPQDDNNFFVDETE
jgi:hypothetical protein